MFVCPSLSKPIRNKPFYIRVFQSLDRTLLEVIGGQESESGIFYNLQNIIISVFFFDMSGVQCLYDLRFYL
jgi:hypothetical protein